MGDVLPDIHQMVYYSSGAIPLKEGILY